MIFPALFLLAASLLPLDEAAYTKLVGANRGKVLIVNFWATWCAPCRAEMPALLSMEKKLAPKGVKLLLISADDADADAKASQFLDSVHATAGRYRKEAKNDEAFINGIDPKWSGALPMTVIYDRTGKRVKTFTGEVDVKQVEAVVSSL